MSLDALIDLATARENGAPEKSQPFVTTADPGAAPDDPNTPEATNQSPVTTTGSVLVAAIPSEVLVVYTAFVTLTSSRFTPTAVQAATIDTAQLGDLADVRIGVAAAAAFGIVVYLYQGWKAAADNRRRFPLAEITAAVIAFVAWALAMPDGLLGLWSSPGDLTTTSAAVATAAVLLLVGISGPLKRKAKDKVKDEPAAH